MRFVLLAVLAAPLLTGCGGGGEAPPPNVVFVITDTVRADKLGCYGGERGLTPRLDELAAQGLRFANAASHAPWTLPSIASMLTSLHPAEHGAGGHLGSFTRMGAAVTTLPAVFGARGYRTHAIANVAFLQKEQFGVTRDFGGLDIDAPSSNLEMRDAERTTDAALQWLDGNAGDPFFLLVHYFDPHAVYAPPRAFRKRFAGPLDQDNEDFVFGTRNQMMALRRGELPIVPQMIRRAEKLYDGEVAFMDAQIGRLLDGLDERGLARDTIVLVTADHGEEFLDHAGYEHGHTLYDELTHVPLLLRYPRAVEPRVVEQTVAHVDIAPTLCELADLSPPEQFVGSSLLEFVRDPSRASRPVLAHGNMWGQPLTSWRSGDHKLIVRGDGAAELYEVRSDRRELRNVAAQDPAALARLTGELEAVKRYMDGLQRGEGVRELPAELQETLDALGYGGGGEDEESEDEGDAEGGEDEDE